MWIALMIWKSIDSVESWFEIPRHFELRKKTDQLLRHLGVDFTLNSSQFCTLRFWGLEDCSSGQMHGNLAAVGERACRAHIYVALLYIKSICCRHLRNFPLNIPWILMKGCCYILSQAFTWWALWAAFVFHTAIEADREYAELIVLVPIWACTDLLWLSLR